LAVIAFATLPVLALVFSATVRGLLADLPLGRGAAITSTWVSLAIGTLTLGAVGFVALPLVLALAGRFGPSFRNMRKRPDVKTASYSLSWCLRR
jgi:hypothetical protein